MKRDMDLVRKILFEVEKLPHFDKKLPRGVKIHNEIHIDGYTKEEIAYHIALLKEADLIDAKHIGTQHNKDFWKPIRLTWEGHEFLDAARDNTRWEKAQVAMTKAGGFALDVMKQLLIQYLKAELKLP